jgi:hypothetical protein
VVAERVSALVETLDLDPAKLVEAELALTIAKKIDFAEPMMIPALSKELRSVLASLTAGAPDALLARIFEGDGDD